METTLRKSSRHPSVNLGLNVPTGGLRMTRLLGALVALPEDVGWIPAPKWWLTNTCNRRLRGPDALFWPPQHAHSAAQQNCTSMCMHTQKSHFQNKHKPSAVPLNLSQHDMNVIVFSLCISQVHCKLLKERKYKYYCLSGPVCLASSRYSTDACCVKELLCQRRISGWAG